jgi:hypothetical protein
MAALKMRQARGDRRNRWNAAPNASQGRQLGRAASVNRRRPAPLQDLEGQRMSEEDIPQPEGDSEQHHAHPRHLPQQTREPVPHADPRTDGGQQRIAGAGSAGDNRGERHKRDHLGGVMHHFHARRSVDLIYGGPQPG